MAESRLRPLLLWDRQASLPVANDLARESRDRERERNREGACNCCGGECSSLAELLFKPIRPRLSSLFVRLSLPVSLSLFQSRESGACMLSLSLSIRLSSASNESFDWKIIHDNHDYIPLHGMSIGYGRSRESQRPYAKTTIEGEASLCKCLSSRREGAGCSGAAGRLALCNTVRPIRDCSGTN